jgi:hypothetical protein
VNMADRLGGILHEYEHADSGGGNVYRRRHSATYALSCRSGESSESGSSRQDLTRPRSQRFAVQGDGASFFL